MDVNIRKMNLKDLNEVMEIEKECFNYTYPKNLIESILLTYSNCFYVAEDKETNELVGYIMGTLEWGNGHIVSIGVRKKYRNRGIGKKLINVLESYYFNVCKSQYVVLEVRPDNKIARVFYRRLGYVDRRVLFDYYDDGSDAILMIKKNPTLNYVDNTIVINMW